ncbi:SDR family oxidoreductase [Aldersonia sp. NBC_00410]|uniref:SDR family oxidoreductase n=1 Tax=Aldersonia sp. NBC_00410 TaxID=2975954 RepID=UPI0022597725|nr:SDR family oxidoreductase [Aldersonia sp. NBC_00410]MCX5046736.1 SDR family oxidoreductase [Aldersonia sp. NBC_00410]
MPSEKSLQNLHVAITGGARGIGGEIARAFVARGATVVIADIDIDIATTTAAELGTAVLARQLDVSDPAAFAAFLDEVEATGGPLDVLVNNAGIMPIGPFLDEPDAITTRTIDIDVRAVLTGTKLAGARFAERGGGHVVNIASVMGTMASPNAATYCAAKFALVGFGQALRQEWRGTGVEITTVCPGFVRTELIAGMRANALMERLAMVDPDAVAKVVVAAVTSGRSGEVYVPKQAELLSKGTGVLPGRLRDFLFRIAGGDKVTNTVNEQARADYRRRVAGAEPAERPFGAGVQRNGEAE